MAIAQVGAGLDPAGNRDLVREIGAEAAALRPGLLVFPEATMLDFGGPDLSLAELAEPLDGPFVHALGAAAADCGAVVVAGMFERRTEVERRVEVERRTGVESRTETGPAVRPYNTVVAVSPDGRLLASYRKLHLYDAFSYRESDRLAPGADDPPVVDIATMRVGIMTCYDLRFPEVGRLLVDGGADVLLVPAAWVRGERKVEHWQALLAARAIENTVYVVGAAQPGPRYSGHSAILDPTGLVQASAGHGRALVWADLDPAVVSAARVANPSLANRRYTVTRR